MKVITLASRKGGAGKTTLVAHLAVEADRTGAGRIAIVDLDPQGNLTDWWNARAAATPIFLDAREGLDVAIKAARAGGVDLLFVDTPPSITPVAAQAVAAADLVVVPVRASPNDLRAVAGTVEMVEEAEKPMLFVANSVTLRARITAQAAIALSAHGAVAPTMLSTRVDYATCLTDGRTAGELDPRSKSAAEVSALWTHIEAILEGKGPRARTRRAA